METLQKAESTPTEIKLLFLPISVQFLEGIFQNYFLKYGLFHNVMVEGKYRLQLIKLPEECLIMKTMQVTEYSETSLENREKSSRV